MQNEYLYRGDELTAPASAFTTKNTIAAGLPLGGEAAAIGDLIGVMTTGAAASTDLIAMKQKGVFNLPVVGTSGSNAAITAGAKLYFNPATGQVDITAANVFFGWALDPVNSGATTTIRVKLKH